MADSGTGSGAEQLSNLPEWDLTDLYPSPDSDAVQSDIAAALANCEAFADRYKGKLQVMTGDKADDLAAAIADFERLEDQLGKLASYASLLYASDTTNPVHAKFYGDIQEQLTNASAHLLFFTLELNAIEDDALAGSVASSEALAYYKPWLDVVRQDKPYQLSEQLEQLFHEKSVTGRGAWNRLFDDTMARLTFDLDGEALGLEATLNRLVSKDGARRKAASDALAKTFGEQINTFTLITNTLAKDKEISDRWRGFEDIADSRHLANRVEREVVDALVSAVRDSYPRLSHRYYAMKAKWLGMDQLNHWDRNAPLPDSDDRVIEWSEARKIVLDAYAQFSPDVASIAGDFFERGWIDAPVRPGKAPGAFAHPTVPSAHPYVLVNYQGKIRDVMTLAHELGHGVHQVLAGGQGALMAETPLTLAETASVFGEMLTFRSLLDATPDKAARKRLLASKVEDMLNTVVRQIAFYCFERLVHAERRKGELTSERLGELWLDVQKESLGPSIRLGEGYETFWAYIPHFIHAPFYVYAYAFGDCLVNSLYARYQDAEAGFAEKYIEMLKAGGSKHHKDLLAPFDLDASDPQFWSMGLSVIEAMVDEIEALDQE
ncbi:M3 family oligoendopeptidase [Coralliovum pocilloporae]|uniref:M3 family oligoendopeptidase n=1 Tax=Coralliovum pocilloporae TaxID=3066369 RepID=UPI003307C29A